MPKPTRTAWRRYQQFHGRSPRRSRFKRFYQPRHLIRLGQCVRIEYLADKYNGGGDGKKTLYYHDHETPVYLYMDERGAFQLYLLGDELKVTRRGIEN